jgi:hypothetical protein
VNKVILNWQKPLWEGDQEVAKRSGRNEPMWVAMHKCMEAMLGISLYIYLYLKPAKTMSFLLSHVFFSTKSEKKLCLEAELEGSEGRWHRQCIPI